MDQSHLLNHFLNLLKDYKIKSEKIFQNHIYEQNIIIKKFEDFIHNNPNCFYRENNQGHITGSAFVINRSFTKVLFTYHAKLRLWLQLGGHADGDYCIQNVALKEAQEESGIENFSFIDILNKPIVTKSTEFHQIIPFDLDIHTIPALKSESAHEHYDVRFVLIAEDENFKISPESLDLKWIPLEEVNLYTSEKSTLRQVEKWKKIRQLYF